MWWMVTGLALASSPSVDAMQLRVEAFQAHQLANNEADNLRLLTEVLPQELTELDALEVEIGAANPAAGPELAVLSAEAHLHLVGLAYALRPPAELTGDEEDAFWFLLGEQVWTRYAEVERAALLQLDDLAMTGGDAGADAAQLLVNYRSSVELSLLPRRARRELKRTVRQVRR